MSLIVILDRIMINLFYYTPTRTHLMSLLMLDVPMRTFLNARRTRRALALTARRLPVPPQSAHGQRDC